MAAAELDDSAGHQGQCRKCVSTGRKGQQTRPLKEPSAPRLMVGVMSGQAGWRVLDTQRNQGAWVTPTDHTQTPKEWLLSVCQSLGSLARTLQDCFGLGEFQSRYGLRLLV